MDWNPVTKPYCNNCPYYMAIGQYIYQLERDKELRKCRYLRICHRISETMKPRQMELSDFMDMNQEG